MRASRLQLVGLFSLSLFGLALALLADRPIVKSAKPNAGQPRLIVLVVIDQFRGDYLQRWMDLFGEGGFKRLTSEGAWFTNCHYPYANTMTGPGHATLSTGCLPAKHGIIANEWYDRRAAAPVYCASLPRYDQVPPSKAEKKREGASPERLLAPTLADVLKEATDHRGRVVAVSLKDRSSVMPGGRTPDVCYWVDRDGRFVTSTYYRDRPHTWVTDFNKSGATDRWLGKTWERLRPALDYAPRSGPDDAAGEGKGVFQGKTFPHPMNGGPKKSKRDYYAAVANSPFGNDLLLAFTRRAVEEEKLGSRETPDFLSVSFSSNDLIGHVWGPDSQEVLDVTLRTDQVIKELLNFLDEKVGKGKYTLALSADHGICPLPEASRAADRDARRVPLEPMLKAAEAHLNRTFPSTKATGAETGRWIEASISNMIYLNRKLLSRRGAGQSEVEAELARWLATQPGIQAAYTRSELLAVDSRLDAVGQKVRASFHPDRSGDVMLVSKPYYLVGSALLTGTTHGTPHDYDTYVPLVVFGQGIKAGVHKESVTPLTAPVILARALGLKPPAGATVSVPEKLFLSGTK